MDTSGHRYVKPVTITTGPTFLAVVIPSFQLAPRQTSRRSRTLCGHLAWTSYSRRRGPIWSPGELRDGLDPESLWAWLEARCYPKARLWVVSPSASDMLTLMGFWAKVDAGEWQVHQRSDDPDAPRDRKTGQGRAWVGQLVLRGRPDIVTARRRGCSVTFVSLRNYTDATMSELARYTNLDTEYPPPPTERQGDPGHGVEAKRAIVTKTIQSLVSEWIAGDCGPWRATSGQLVVSLWRRRFMQRKVCRHSDPDVARLETDAMHGGRASVWYFGDAGSRDQMPGGLYAPPSAARWWALPGQVHRLDMTSMYPSILRDQAFPVRAMKHCEGISVEKLEALAEHRGVIATVLADVTRAEYPYRCPKRVAYRWPGEGSRSRQRRIEFGARTLYPLGQCTLTLAGPELLRLAREGSILKVHRYTVYEMGRPFVALMDYLLSQREAARERGSAFLYALYKSWAVSFGGKFAQSGTRWRPMPDVVPPVRWGEYRDHDADSGETTYWRAFGGLASIREVGQPGASLLAAVFAYLTSYGRCLMRDVRDGLPGRSVLSQDTDGIWCTDAGLSASAIGKDRSTSAPGTLRLVGSHRYARWYTPKHYYCDGSWTLAGVADGYGIAKDDYVTWRSLTNQARGTPDRPPTVVQETLQRVRLDLIGPSEFIDQAGWSVPPVLRGGRVQPAYQATAPADDLFS